VPSAAIGNRRAAPGVRTLEWYPILPKSGKPAVTLAELIPADDLRGIQESFEAAVGVPMLFTDEAGRPILEPPSSLLRFCAAFLAGVDAQARPCLLCSRRDDLPESVVSLYEAASSAHTPIVHECPGGFLDAAVPIRLHGKTIGYAVFARVLDHPADTAALRAVAAGKGLDTEACLEAARQAPILTRQRIEALATHLDKLTGFVIGVAADHYHAQQELALAGEIQRRLIPEWFHVDGFEIALQFQPCSSTGGDLLGAFRLGGGDSVLYVGDVSGHGVAAALLMGHISGALGGLRHANVWPAETLERLNDRFIQHFGGHSAFATLFVARYMASEGVLLYANAGHEPPLMLRARDGVIEELPEPRGYPLGFVDHPGYTHGYVTIEPGDMLLLYTDGLIERKTAGGEWSDVGRLKRALAETRGLSAFGARDMLAARMAEGDWEPATDDAGFLVARRQRESEVAFLSDAESAADGCRRVVEDLRARGIAEDDLCAIRLALDEVITNAVKHGNALDPRKLVRVHYAVSEAQAKFRVTDEGAGIWQAGLKPLTREHFAGSGYGLALVRGVIDHVEWAPGGTEVFLSKYRADAPDTVAERRPC